jgi:hypothetical protein
MNSLENKQHYANSGELKFFFNTKIVVFNVQNNKNLVKNCFKPIK